jgi:hypothetical protein
MSKFAQLEKSVQEGLYPQTSKLQEQLATQALGGMGSQMPDWMQQQYISNRNAMLGNNVSSPIGQDYRSRGLMEDTFNWQNYYRNLGLQVAGRQPLVQPERLTSTYTPSGVMGMMSSVYPQQVQASMYSYNAEQAAQQQANSNPWLNVLGTVGGGLLGSLGGGLGTSLGSKIGAKFF